MNALIGQASEPEQIRGRESRIRVNHVNQQIVYKACNGMLFVIDTRPTNKGRAPLVLCPSAIGRGPSHHTHCYGNGCVDPPCGLAGKPLGWLLHFCDSFAVRLDLLCKGHLVGDT